MLKYKGTVFDDYVQDEDGHYWSQICPDCIAKYFSAPSTDFYIDDFGSGVCGIEGCDNHFELYEEESTKYIDFSGVNVEVTPVNVNYKCMNCKNEDCECWEG
jgi:hypothetical protein